ncbi:hypothetical protein X975_09798, partial [Stegodyphus mimosarum]
MMKNQRILLALFIGQVLFQVVTSKECLTNLDCSEKQCCVLRDGAAKCAALAKKGQACSLISLPLNVEECPCKSGLTCQESNGRLTCAKA